MTQEEARAEMFGMLNASWVALAASAVANVYVPEIFWQGQMYPSPPPVDKAYGRATVLHVAGRQQSLAGEGGARRYGRRGMVVVQVFGPMNDGKGLKIAGALAKIVTDTYEGKSSPSGIWFRNVRFNEIGADDGRFQINAYADFQYDEVK